MATDLFGNRLGKPPTFELSLHQKRQATLLYYWTSQAYLHGLLKLIDALMQGMDVTLELARIQGRDDLIANERWGIRDTAGNWGNMAWPALQEFKESTIWHIAQQPKHVLGVTGLNQCGRLIGELSPHWMMPDEKEWFDAQWKVLFDYAYRHDEAVGAGTRRPLRDRAMVEQWAKLSSQFPQIPKFVVCTDREYESGQLPDRTGVYVPVDDPNGTLQFAWTGSDEGALGDCVTFSSFGLEILRGVGRERMWLDRRAMVKVIAPMYETGKLQSRGGFDVGAEFDPECVASVIGRECFVRRPCKWYYVERLDGQFEDAALAQASERADSVPGADRLRCDAGRPCPREGYWFTPAAQDSRRLFKLGEVMPSFDGDYGQTIWQWSGESNV
ncbi:MAG: hypothetical protein KAX73_07745 [Aquabacterium sp.]|nr:hypothetical protein [Aquabacterium sp.]